MDGLSPTYPLAKPMGLWIIVTMALSCTVSEIRRRIGRKLPNYLPRLDLTPPLGVANNTDVIFVWRCTWGLCDPRFRLKLTNPLKSRSSRGLCYSSATCTRINLPINFEVPNFTRYWNMKGIAKCRRWGSLGWLGVTHSYRQCHH